MFLARSSIKPLRFALVVLAAALLPGPFTPAFAANDEMPDPVEIESGNPMSGDPEAIEAGAFLYGRLCVQCHGAKADGVSPGCGKREFDLRVWWRGYEKFIKVVAIGKLPRMPPFGEYLDFDQVSQIGAFLEIVSIEGANWKCPYLGCLRA